MGDMPHYRLIKKNETTNKWDNIGAVWNRENGGFSVIIELVRGGEKIKCLMVENKPKASTEPTPPIPDNLSDTIPF